VAVDSRGSAVLTLFFWDKGFMASKSPITKSPLFCDFGEVPKSQKSSTKLPKLLDYWYIG
jgi:hypothetical protein